MRIGALGKFVFTVTPNIIRTFDGLSISSAGRFAKHEIVGRKPLTQYIGPGLQTISFNVQLSGRHGVNPQKEIEILAAMEAAGRAVPLTVGSRVIGKLWIITQLQQSWQTVDHSGNIVSASVAVSLEEYEVKAK